MPIKDTGSVGAWEKRLLAVWVGKEVMCKQCSGGWVGPSALRVTGWQWGTPGSRSSTWTGTRDKHRTVQNSRNALKEFKQRNDLIIVWLWKDLQNGQWKIFLWAWGAWSHTARRDIGGLLTGQDISLAYTWGSQTSECIRITWMTGHETQIIGLHSQTFWFGRYGKRPQNVHF